MNKQAISLVEVLVAVMLISVVIVSILQIKENNLYFLEKSKESTKYNAYISMIALDNDKTKLNNDNIYLSDKINFKDDEIRKVLKEIKIKRKEKELKPIEFNSEEYNLQINIKQTKLSIEDKIQKNFYRFSLVN